MLAAILSTLCFAACGGGADSGTTAGVTTPATGAAKERSSTPPNTEAEPHQNRSSAGSGGTSSAGEPADGSDGSGSTPKGTRSFIEPGGDNTIPTYGSEASRQRAAAAEAALRRFLAARAAADWDQVCALLSPLSVEQVEKLGKGHSCAATLGQIFAGADSSDLASSLRRFPFRAPPRRG